MNITWDVLLANKAKMQDRRTLRDYTMMHIIGSACLAAQRTNNTSAARKVQGCTLCSPTGHPTPPLSTHPVTAAPCPWGKQAPRGSSKRKEEETGGKWKIAGRAWAGNNRQLAIWPLCLFTAANNTCPGPAAHPPLPRALAYTRPPQGTRDKREEGSGGGGR